ncbi:MAG: tRNA-dependent cyclodipeptide synthase [Candidatus Andersenbacteria bacterium]
MSKVVQNVPVVGMSPGNSYFSEEIIEWLLQKVAKQYGTVSVFIADIPAISTYTAVGYSEKEARAKAVLKSNNLKNKVARAIEKLNLDKKDVHVVDWKNEIEENLEYRRHYGIVRKMYDENGSFRKDTDDTTAFVLKGLKKEDLDIQVATQIANHYLLSELAFLEFAPTFFSAAKVTYVYHAHWMVYEKYINGAYDGKPRNKLGFQIVTKA